MGLGSNSPRPSHSTASRRGGARFPPDARFTRPRGRGSCRSRRIGDVIYSEHVVDVKPPAGASVGGMGVSASSSFGAGSPGQKPWAEQVSRLIGVDNALRIGSRHNSAVDRLRSARRGAARVDPGRRRRLSARRRAQHSSGSRPRSPARPWVVWAETPENIALGPADTRSGARCSRSDRCSWSWADCSPGSSAGGSPGRWTI